LHGSLEDAYMQLTADDVEYHSATIGSRQTDPVPTQPSATALLTEGALR
jgi:ABC-2 type transport system ATP-binding protein